MNKPNLGACPTLTILLRRTIRNHLRRSRPEKILNVFQRIRLRFFRACGLASGLVTKAMSDRLLAKLRGIRQKRMKSESEMSGLVAVWVAGVSEPHLALRHREHGERPRSRLLHCIGARMPAHAYRRSTSRLRKNSVYTQNAVGISHMAPTPT
jgi:hypothetical protein